MALTSKEQKILEGLMKKKDAPEPAQAAKALNISIDLGDEKQVERARALGLLDFITSDDDDDDGGDDDDDDGKGDEDEEVPKRRGYFKGDK